jgi:hypothetical protein
MAGTWGVVLWIYYLYCNHRQPVAITRGLPAGAGIPSYSFQLFYSYSTGQERADPAGLSLLSLDQQTHRSVCTLKKTRERDGNAAFIKTVIVVLQLIVLSYVLALGVNIASYYAHPHYVNYGGFGFHALFGYNDQPGVHAFSGFGRALGIDHCLFSVDHITRRNYIQPGGTGCRKIVPDTDR